MLDETMLVAAICGSRQAYDEAKNIGLDLRNLGEAARFIVRAAGQQYRRDAAQKAIDRHVLQTQIVREYGDGSMCRSVMDFVKTLPEDISGINVIEEVRLTQLASLSTELATRLASGQHDQATKDLLDSYAKLSNGDGTGTQAYRLGPTDFEGQQGQRIALSPSGLNDFIGGGVLRGHNITVYGRPDSGKSMFALNQAAFCLTQGYKVLYVANEEPAQDITRRLLSRLTGRHIGKLQDVKSVSAAMKRCEEAYSNWYLFHEAGATAADISKQASLIKPDLIVVDQLKNIAISEDNRALQLDRLARHVRELGIKHKAVTMSVTQAGESAQNRLVLGMSDVEWSNTGIPGAADLMIGIGVNDEFDGANKRMLSIPKNKINGRHGAFHVFIEPTRTAFMTQKRG